MIAFCPSANTWSVLAAKASEYIFKIQVCAQRTIKSTNVYQANSSIILVYSNVLGPL